MGWMFVPLTEYHGGGPAATSSRWTSTWTITSGC